MTFYPPPEYIAGFFDANGTVYVADTARNAPRLRISITTSHKLVLVSFQAALHVGTITLHQRRAVYDDQWRLNVTSIPEVGRFLDEIGPHCIIKNTQMILAQKFIDHIKDYGIGRALDAGALAVRLELAYAMSEANGYGRKLVDLEVEGTPS